MSTPSVRASKRAVLQRNSDASSSGTKKRSNRASSEPIPSPLPLLPEAPPASQLVPAPSAPILTDDIDPLPLHQQASSALEPAPFAPSAAGAPPSSSSFSQTPSLSSALHDDQAHQSKLQVRLCSICKQSGHNKTGCKQTAATSSSSGDTARLSGVKNATASSLARTHWFLLISDGVYQCKMHTTQRRGSSYHPTVVKGANHLLDHIHTWHEAAFAALTRDPTPAVAIQQVSNFQPGQQQLAVIPKKPPARAEFERELKVALWLGSNNLSPKVLNDQFRHLLDGASLVSPEAFRKRVVPLAADAIRVLNSKLMAQSYPVSITIESTFEEEHDIMLITYHFCSRDGKLCSIPSENIGVHETSTTQEIVAMFRAQFQKDLLLQPFAVTSGSGRFSLALSQIFAQNLMPCACQLFNLVVEETFQVGFGMLQDFNYVNDISFMTRAPQVLSALYPIQIANSRPPKKGIMKTGARWNQDKLQLQRFLQLLPDLRLLIDSDPNAPYFTDEQAQFIRLFEGFRFTRYMDMLDSIERLSSLSEGDGYPTLSCIAPSVMALKQHFQEIQAVTNSNQFEAVFASKFCENLLNRFAYLFDEQEIALPLIASALDIRHGHLSFLSPELKNRVWASIANRISHPSTTPSAPSASDDDYWIAPSTGTLYDDIQRVRSKFEQNHALKKTGLHPIEFWMKNSQNLHQGLVKLALAILAVPASTVPYEQLHSANDLAMKVKRRKLNFSASPDWVVLYHFTNQSNFQSDELFEEAWKIANQSTTLTIH